jgi:hypothetical protein
VVVVEQLRQQRAADETAGAGQQCGHGLGHDRTVATLGAWPLRWL